MAKLLSYRSVREILDGTHSEEKLSDVINRIPIFILLRCNLEGETASSYAMYKKICKKYPLYKDFALSRFITTIRAKEMVSYYIPKLDFDFWTERYVYYSGLFPYEKVSNFLNQESGLYEIYLTWYFYHDIYNLYFELIIDMKLVIERFCPTDIFGFFIRRACTKV